MAARRERDDISDYAYGAFAHRTLQRWLRATGRLKAARGDRTTFDWVIDIEAWHLFIFAQGLFDASEQQIEAARHRYGPFGSAAIVIRHHQRGSLGYLPGRYTFTWASEEEPAARQVAESSWCLTRRRVAVEAWVARQHEKYPRTTPAIG